MRLILFCILLVLCWPLALAALVLYPIVWLVLLPFRLVGIVVGGTFELIGALFSLPGRMLRSIYGNPVTAAIRGSAHAG